MTRVSPCWAGESNQEWFELRYGRTEAAAASFRRTLEQRPQDFWSNFHRGLRAYRLSRFQEAFATFRTGAVAPEAASCPYFRALADEAMGQAAEADRDDPRSLGLGPALKPAQLNRGILSQRTPERSITGPRVPPGRSPPRRRPWVERRGRKEAGG